MTTDRQHSEDIAAALHDALLTTLGEAIDGEREACAQIADAVGKDYSGESETPEVIAGLIARRIRERGKAL